MLLMVCKIKSLKCKFAEFYFAACNILEFIFAKINPDINWLTYCTFKQAQHQIDHPSPSRQ